MASAPTSSTGWFWAVNGRTDAVVVPRVGSSKGLQQHAAQRKRGKKRTSSTDVHPIEPIPTSPPSNGADDEVRAAPPPSSHNGTPLSNDSVELRDETLSDEESGGCPEGTQSELWEHKMRRSLSLSARVERGTNPLRSQKKKGGGEHVCGALSVPGRKPRFSLGSVESAGGTAHFQIPGRDF